MSRAHGLYVLNEVTRVDRVFLLWFVIAQRRPGHQPVSVACVIPDAPQHRPVPLCGAREVICRVAAQARSVGLLQRWHAMSVLTGLQCAELGA